MKRLVWTAAAIMLFAVQAPAEPVAAVYDTGMGNDVDDALALGLIHALKSRGECRLLAVTLTKDHPVAAAYVRYKPPPHNRPAWDLASVLYAVRPDRGYFGLSEPGRVIVEDDGGTRFEPDPNGPHRYLTADAQQCIRVTELFVALCSQPPSLGPLDGDGNENE